MYVLKSEKYNDGKLKAFIIIVILTKKFHTLLRKEDSRSYCHRVVVVLGIDPRAYSLSYIPAFFQKTCSKFQIILTKFSRLGSHFNPQPLKVLGL